MFTAASAALLLLIFWMVSRANQQDPPSRHDDAELRDLIRHSRQDLRLVAFLLCGILLALGVIADRLH